MAKITLSDLLSSFASKSKLNDNFQQIEDELNNDVLYRNNPSGEPNQMENVLDMNSNRVINVGAPVAQTDALRLADLPSSAEQTTASLVTVDDASGYYDTATVEGALQEIWDDLGDTAANEGASRVATEDSGDFYVATDVEATLQEIGPHIQEVVADVATLQASSFETGIERIWLSGYYGLGTPGGGPLYRDAADTTTADNGGTVLVDADGVRWKRNISEPFDVLLFGAKGDGTTDDKVTIENALTVGDVKLGGSRTYRISTSLSVNNEMHIVQGSQMSIDSGITVTFNSLLRSDALVHPLTGAGDASMQRVTKNVPADFSTVQSAIDNCPTNLYQQYAIRLADGTYTEDVHINGIHARSVLSPSSIGETPRLSLTGASLISQDPNVELNSVFISGCVGQGNPSVGSMTITGVTPTNNENSQIAVFGSFTDCQLGDLRFNDISGTAVESVISYSSNVRIGNSDYGSSLLTRVCTVKGGGRVHDNSSGGSVGTVESYALLSNGLVVVNDAYAINLTGPVAPRAGLDGSGLLFDVRSGELYTGETSGGFETSIGGMPESLDGWDVITSGSGGVTLNSEGIRIDTGATSGSEATVEKAARNLIGDNSFNNQYQRFDVAFHSIDGYTDLTLHLVRGENRSGQLNYGFKIVNGVLSGIVNNGTSETAVVLDNTFNDGFAQLTAKFTSRGTRVEFFSQGVWLGRITSGLPTGSATATVPRIVQFSAVNSAAVNKRTVVSEWRLTKHAPSV